MVFNGHDHLYERSYKTSDTGGVHYVVTAGGGAELYPINQARNYFQVYAKSIHHFCIVDVSAENLSITAYDSDGRPFDFVEITPFNIRPSPLGGDLDGDGSVGPRDMLLMRENWYGQRKCGK